MKKDLWDDCTGRERGWINEGAERASPICFHIFTFFLKMKG